MQAADLLPPVSSSARSQIVPRHLGQQTGEMQAVAQAAVQHRVGSLRLLADREEGRPNVPGVDDGRGCPDSGPRQGVGQFSDISRPGVLQQQISGLDRELLRHPAGLPVALGVDALQNVIDQQAEIARPLAERRQAQNADCQPMEQVLSKALLGDFVLQVPIGGGNDANVDGLGPCRAEPLDSPFLQAAQEFDLGGQGQLTDFVEEQAAGVSRFEIAGFGLSAGERPFRAAKELGFHQLAWNCPAVDLNKRPWGSGAGGVNRSGKQLLAGSRLALDQDRNVVHGQPSGSGNLGFHRLTAVDDRPELRGFLGQSLGEAQDLVSVDVRQVFSRKLERERYRAHAVFKGRLYQLGGMVGFGQNNPHCGHGRRARTEVIDKPRVTLLSSVQLVEHRNRRLIDLVKPRRAAQTDRVQARCHAQTFFQPLTVAPRLLRCMVAEQMDCVEVQLVRGLTDRPQFAVQFVAGGTQVGIAQPGNEHTSGHASFIQDFL